MIVKWDATSMVAERDVKKLWCNFNDCIMHFLKDVASMTAKKWYNLKDCRKSYNWCDFNDCEIIHYLIQLTNDIYCVRYIKKKGLRKKAARCSFGDNFQDNINDQIIEKCESRWLRGELEDADLTKIINVANAFEAVAEQEKDFCKDEKTYHLLEHVCNVGSSSKFMQSGECTRCGYSGHRSFDDKCPAKDVILRKWTKILLVQLSNGHQQIFYLVKRNGSYQRSLSVLQKMMNMNLKE